jgi:hypothetical protein
MKEAWYVARYLAGLALFVLLLLAGCEVFSILAQELVR